MQPHPSCSPDLAHSDYHLFRSIAHFLRGRNFENTEAVEVGLAEFFTSKTRHCYQRGIINIAERWLKTIESDGFYFEEWFNFMSENIPNKLLFKKTFDLRMRDYQHKENKLDRLLKFISLQKQRFS